jgi:hypothetical protein
MLIYESSKRDIVDHCKSLGFTNSETQAYLSYVQRKEQAIQNGGIKGLTNRDSDTRRVYRSEWAFQKQVKIRKFDNIKQVQRRMDQILDSSRWYNLCGPFVTLEINTRMGIATAGRAFSNKKIQLSESTGMDEYTLLHELCHQLPNCFNHSIEFRSNLIKLVSSFMGRDAAKILKTEFKENKLKLSHSKPQSPETWIKGVERAAMLRERRAQKQVI